MNNKVILDKDLDALFIMETLVNNANEILGIRAGNVLKEKLYRNTSNEKSLFKTWFNKCVVDLENKYGRNEFDPKCSKISYVIRSDVYNTYKDNELIENANFIYMKHIYQNIVAKYTEECDWSIKHFPYLVDVVINNILDKESDFYKRYSYDIIKNNYIIKAFFNSFCGNTNMEGYILTYKGNLQEFIISENQDFLYRLKMEEKDNLRYYKTDILVLEKEDFISEISKKMLNEKYKYSKVIYKDLLHISKNKFDFPN